MISKKYRLLDRLNTVSHKNKKLHVVHPCIKIIRVETSLKINEEEVHKNTEEKKKQKPNQTLGVLVITTDRKKCSLQ